MIEWIVAAGLTLPIIGLLCIESIFLLYWIDKEYSGLATLSVAVTAGIMQWGFGVDIIDYVRAHPSHICYGAIGYFVFGTIWAITKWWFFVRAERRKYDAFKSDFLRKHEITGDVIPDDLKERFSEEFPRYGSSRIEVHPQVTEHKARIYMWLSYWPFSALWTLINDPVRRVFTEIYSHIRATLQRISDAAWAGTDQDFATKNKKK